MKYKFIGLPIGFASMMLITVMFIEANKTWWISQLSGLLLTIIIFFFLTFKTKIFKRNERNTIIRTEKRD